MVERIDNERSYLNYKNHFNVPLVLNQYKILILNKILKAQYKNNSIMLILKF